MVTRALSGELHKNSLMGTNSMDSLAESWTVMTKVEMLLDTPFQLGRLPSSASCQSGRGHHVYFLTEVTSKVLLSVFV